MLKFIHAADFHLDSAFGALTARQASSRRAEMRETLVRLTDYVNKNGIGLVLLAGDLFDSGSIFRETVEQLSLRRGEMLILLSDGAGGEESVRRCLEGAALPPEELAERILACSKAVGTDDATVAIVRLTSLPPTA